MRALRLLIPPLSTRLSTPRPVSVICLPVYHSFPVPVLDLRKIIEMKNHLFALCIACLLLFFASCSNQQSSAPAMADSFPPALTSGLRAHGGLDNWKKYRTLQFTLASKENPENHLIDLDSRKVLITTDTSFTMGFDGQSVWVSPSLQSYPGSSARFYHNLIFYFFSIPFVMTDPGTVHSDMPDAQLNGVAYRRVRVTFGNDVGDSPKDQYILWFRKDNDRLGLINYSVTYFDQGNADRFNAIVYEEWQQVNELLLPKTWTHHRWENDSLGEARSTVRIENVSLSTISPDASLFAVPAEAEIESPVTPD